jgi:sugar lactone lactonase YvrE
MMKTIFKLVILLIFSITISCDNETFNDPDSAELASKSQKADLKTLARGAALHGANGIDIGPDGNLYVASVNGQEIAVINKNNGKIIKRFGPGSGVLGPDDLVFGPDGTLYWTDILTGYVGRMTQDGQQLGYQFVAPGVNPIAFNDEGRLFVGLDFLGDGLYELDPNLSAPPRPIIIASTANPYPLGFLNSFDFGTDGRLYGPLFAAGMVVSVDVDSGTAPTSDPFTDGTVRIESMGYKNPAAAKFDPKGLLTVIDQTGEVFKIDLQDLANPGDNVKTLFTTLEPGLDNMVFAKDGTLYMTNNDEGWVAEILKSKQARIISVGGMIQPEGLAVLPDSNNQDALFVADLFLLRQFNGTSGQQEKSYKGYLVPVPGDPIELALPMNLSADGNNIIVSSWFSSAVQVWNPTDGVLENYTIPVPIDAIRFKGGIIVSEASVGGLIWASDQSLIAKLTVPSGLTTDGETVWAADWATGKIYQLDYDGASLVTPVEVVSGLDKPEGLAVDDAGRLVVVETGASRLTRIDLVTGTKTILAEGLALSTPGLGEPPSWYFDGVAIGQSGDIYLSGGGANVIYKVPKK